jgi:dynein heavy chain 2, cytosolic
VLSRCGLKNWKHPLADTSFLWCWYMICHRSIMQVAENIRCYERENKALHIQLTPDTLRTIAQFDAALSQPGGSLLLVGSCGIGRRAAVELVAYIHHLVILTPACAVTYGVRQFRGFLKDVVRSAGVEGVPTLLLLEDHHLVDTFMLEAVNSLLASAEVPGLFTAEEASKELKPLDEAKVAAGHLDVSTFDFFVALVRKV